MLETTFLIHHLRPPATSASSSIRSWILFPLYCKIFPVQVEIFKEKDKLFIAPLVPFSYHQTIKQIIYHH